MGLVDRDAREERLLKGTLICLDEPARDRILACNREVALREFACRLADALRTYCDEFDPACEAVITLSRQFSLNKVTYLDLEIAQERASELAGQAETESTNTDCRDARWNSLFFRALTYRCAAACGYRNARLAAACAAYVSAPAVECLNDADSQDALRRILKNCFDSLRP